MAFQDLGRVFLRAGPALRARLAGGLAVTAVATFQGAKFCRSGAKDILPWTSNRSCRCHEDEREKLTQADWAAHISTAPLKGVLAQRRAVVTGGGSGVGRGIALAFAREGCEVVIGDVSEQGMAKTIELGAELPGRIHPCRCDTSTAADAAVLIEFATEKIGGVDILVNSAGTNVLGESRTLKNISVDDWHRIIDVNLHGCFPVSHAVLPGMRAQKSGTIINISSLAGKRVVPGVLAGGAYSASKFGLNALGNVINLEEWQHGIRCTTMCPGEVNTDHLNKRATPPSKEQRAKMLQPEDLGEIAVFISSLPQRVFMPEVLVTGSTTINFF